MNHLRFLGLMFAMLIVAACNSPTAPEEPAAPSTVETKGSGAAPPSTFEIEEQKTDSEYAIGTP